MSGIQLGRFLFKEVELKSSEEEKLLRVKEVEYSNKYCSDSSSSSSSSSDLSSSSKGSSLTIETARRLHRARQICVGAPLSPIRESSEWQEENSSNTSSVAYEYQGSEEQAQVHKIKEQLRDRELINNSEIKIIKKIGEGAFGKVYEVCTLFRLKHGYIYIYICIYKRIELMCNTVFINITRGLYGACLWL